MEKFARARVRRSAMVALALALPVAAVAILPFPAKVVPNVYDYANYLFLDKTDCQGDHSDLPANVDCGGVGDFQTTNYRDTTRIDTSQSAQELYGVVGPSTNMAWRITTGRPDVVIAVIDDGVQWDQSVGYLNRKYYINRGELPMPPGGPNAADTIFGGYDVNGDGVFNSIDYAGAVADLNGNGFVDPQDLIRTYSDSVDDDGNGYVDDIAGWDFYENDNDPNDDVDFGHGNGRSRDAVAEAGVEDGQCPNCMVMPLRVGDSFIADVNHFGEAIEDALGTLNHTSFGQAAVDYAYYHGVIINASEADEAAGHHNWPAAYDHTMVVNAIGDAGIDQAAVPNSFLHLLGCTNFGGYSFVSIPGVKCSSEAAGRSAGVSGLLVSAAKNAIDRGDMTRYVRDDGSLASFPLSGEEMKQLWRLAADDIDFASPCPDHAFCDEPPSGVPSPTAPANNYAINTPDSIRYQSVRGWDYFTGYAYPGLEIAVGSHDNHVYVWHQDGTLVPGWPVVLRDPAKVATMNPVTHNFTLLPGVGAVRDGTKVIVSPSLGDLDGDGDLEIVVGVNEQYAEDPNAALAPELLALGYLVVPGNARIYALHHDGANHPATPAQAATPHTQDQAYVAGWPVPIAVIQTDLLPDVGTGTNGQSPLADIDGDGTLEVVTASAAGPGYILNHDGTSFLGTVDGGKYRTLTTSGGAATDVPSYIAVGALSVASLDGGAHLSVLGPGGGLKRVVDVVIPAQQLGGEDHFAFWNATTGAYEPNSPVVVNDLQFFAGPIAGDINGDGLAEGIQGSAVSDTVAVGLGVPSAAATRYHSGGWTVSSAAIGDAPLGAAEDGQLQIATTTREGYLRLYPTSVAAGSAAACTALSQWPEYGHDAHHSGNYQVDAERPYPLRGVSAAGEPVGGSVSVSLIATGDDRACGRAARYEVRGAPADVLDPDWRTATPLGTFAVGADAGQPDSFTVSGVTPGTALLVRAFDQAGNGSAVSRLPEPPRALALAFGGLLLFALSRWVK
ncbi:MAG: hypothetical protein E6J87_06320 [Deltaproteobacteria bacterium]|nr:MAG: hypothetical protein E6J87_06320 [Deltaproteobacteria bacterium]